MQKVVVTGGAGFIGSNLVDRLIDMGISVTVIDDLSTGKKENINPKAEFYECSLVDLNDVNAKTIFSDVDVVFHLAALARVQPSIEDPINFNKINVDGTVKVLYYANKAGVKRVVYSASSSCYGNATIVPTPETHPTNPLSPYGLQKYIGEQYCKMFSEVYDLDTCSLRYFNVYGERMALEGAYCLVMGIFAKQMLEGKPLTITNDGNQRRDFTYVQDVVDANILAATLEGKLKGVSFNIGNGKNYSVNEVADMLGGEKTYGETRLEPFETLADNFKAKSILGWNPKGDLKTWIKKYKKDLGI
jgi:UDP-glucose 4-epimerase|tara:strand:- start:913 stop:1821 length:909 start_codon:yes stop_codon:yes gene_type:complete